MVKIVYGNVNFKIEGLDNRISAKIAETLSYTAGGGFGAKKERKYIYNMATCMGYTGTLPYVINILNKNGIKFEMVDKREKPESNAGFKLVDWVTLRDYQQGVVDTLSNRTIVQCSTGGGKTVMMAGAICKFNVKPVVIMSPKATLAYQLQAEIAKFTGESVGIYCGLEKNVKDITVCTPQTVLKNPEILHNCKAIMFDECQFLGSKTLFDCARNARNAYYRLAVSATPWRDGDDDILIEAAINVRRPKSNINASTLINKGKLTRCEINFVEFDHDYGWCGDYGTTYDKCIVHNNKRNRTVVNLVKKSLDEKLGGILVLFTQVEHGRVLYEMIKDAVGITEETVEIDGVKHKVNSIELISGETKMADRNIILEAARQNKVKILLGSTIADEGLDCPALKVLILTGAGKSSTRAFQRVGRVLRLYEGRDLAKIYDFKDNHPTFINHFAYRRALYSTEPEWKKNMHYIKVA